jgi:hypothetical protein
MLYTLKNFVGSKNFFQLESQLVSKRSEFLYENNYYRYKKLSRKMVPVFTGNLHRNKHKVLYSNFNYIRKAMLEVDISSHKISLSQNFSFQHRLSDIIKITYAIKLPRAMCEKKNEQISTANKASQRVLSRLNSSSSRSRHERVKNVNIEGGLFQPNLGK